MPPTTVLIYGGPSGGTPIMQSAPDAALDLPLRVLVRETPGKAVEIVYHPIDAVLRAAGVSDEVASRLTGAQALLRKAIRKTDEPGAKP